MGNTRKIPIEEWLKMASNGSSITARIQLNGVSMQPLVRRNRDYVTIMPLDRDVMKGDIVMFLRDDGMYVVHRVRYFSEDTVTTLGDNCSYEDRPIPRERVYGLITKVERGKKTLMVDTPFWRGIGRVWMAVLPIRRIIYFVRRKIRACLARVYKRLFKEKLK